MRHIIGVIMISIGVCNASTNHVIQVEIDFYIDKYCRLYKIEKALVKAIIKQESRFRPYSVRMEKHLLSVNWYLNTLTESEKRNNMCFMSYGLMQILYGIAKKEAGYKGTPEGLGHIETNIKYGIKYLRKVCVWEKELTQAISAYNQGVNRDQNGKIYKSKYIDENNNGIKDYWEKWKNWRYVKKVLKYYHQFGGKIK
jgi:soluble lytic murein transglycosylase-like protein